MATSHTVPTHLSNLQSELVKRYAYYVSHNRLKDIRKMLADYFAANIDAEMGELCLHSCCMPAGILIHIPNSTTTRVAPLAGLVFALLLFSNFIFRRHSPVRDIILVALHDPLMFQNAVGM